MKSKQIFSTLIIAALGSIFGVFSYAFVTRNASHIHLLDPKPVVKFTSLNADNYSGYVDLTEAAAKSIHAVVHVKTQYMQNASSGNPLFDFFYGYQQYQTPVQAAGSGVIISEDGYIVTNNHVIDKSDYIEVVLDDKRTFTAKLIGRDETTDIALLKIEEKNLPYLMYGNSDNIKVGEWVLAVGNPFNLTSTVTAGIVSAKARNINILSNQYAIEAFIQTDAAVNPGNSGGALVNTAGELVGINTAIASKTGSYVGYSFAIPVNIVKKIVADILEFGEVQRAYIGAELADLNSKIAEQLNIENPEGVYVYKTTPNGAAAEAGIQSGDVILKVQDIKTNTYTEVLEQLSKYRPGEKIKVSIKRKKELKDYDITLKNSRGSTGIIKTETYDILGAKLQDITSDDKKKLGIRFGLKVTGIGTGKFRSAGVQEGFIIVYVNRQPVRNFEDLQKLLTSTKGGIYVEGIYPNGMTAYYAFGM